MDRSKCGARDDDAINGCNAIIGYNASMTDVDREICQKLMDAIGQGLPGARGRIWHGSPVWFLEDNPIVGYSKLKKGVQLLFWSGQSVSGEALEPVGKFMAAEVVYSNADEVDPAQLSRWLALAAETQWDYKHIVRNKGELVRLK